MIRRLQTFKVTLLFGCFLIVFFTFDKKLTSVLWISQMKRKKEVWNKNLRKKLKKKTDFAKQLDIESPSLFWCLWF